MTEANHKQAKTWTHFTIAPKRIISHKNLVSSFNHGIRKKNRQVVFEVSSDVNIYTVVFGVVTIYSLKMKAEFSSETRVPTYQTTWYTQDHDMKGKWQVTWEGVCKTWRLYRSQELGESSLPVGPQRLYNVADRKWEHDPLHSVGDALGDKDIMLVPGDAYPIDGHNLQNKTFIPSFLAMYEYLTFRTLCIVSHF